MGVSRNGRLVGFAGQPVERQPFADDLASSWTPNKMNADGSFYDYVGKTIPSGKDIVQYQTFTATMLNPDGFLPGVPRAVMVEYPGYRGGQFGTMGHWITTNGVRTNDYWFHPEKGRQICADEPRMRLQ